jgi:hypothetical protein
MNRRGIGRGGPGLIGVAARTAVISGTATAVSGNVARRQQARSVQTAQTDTGSVEAAPAYPGPAPEPAPVSSGPDPIELLKDLAALKAQGLLTDEEFADQKSRILAL